jgi:cathepsin D
VDIIYGSGKVHGTIASDTITFAGFTVTDQELCVCIRMTRVDSDLFYIAVAVTSGSTSSLISNGLSGFMGLGFSSLSALETTPFWETLCNTNQLAEPLFSFYLERHIDQPPMDAAPGGILTLGGTNSSLYQGSIEYMSLAGAESYWLLNVRC